MLRLTRKWLPTALKYGLVPLVVVGFLWKEPYDVLVLAYMRSGSSYMGRVLGVREDTFYWYEPLWKSHAWAYLNDEGEFCNHSYPHCTAVSDKSNQSVKKSLQFLLDVYTCTNLSQYYKSRFGSNMRGRTAYNDPVIAEYKTCLNKSSTQTCFEYMMESCGKAKHRVTKVLRLATVHTQFLLDHHPRLKVVQIFRDPRAVLSSRKHAWWYYRHSKKYYSELGMSVDNGDILSHDAEVLCKRMAGDIDTAKRLRELYPDRMKIVQYEDMNDARKLTETMYRFANMDMTEGARKMMNSMTRNHKVDQRHPTYRETLNWREVTLINRHCRSVFRKLGLRVFKNKKEWNDTTLNSIKDSLPFPLN